MSRFLYIIACSSVLCSSFIAAPKKVNLEDANKKCSDPCCWSNDFKCQKSIYSFFGDWLYFKAVEDDLKFGQLTPQEPTFTPKSRPLDQHFEFSSGFRIGATYQVPHNNIELGADWMNYSIDEEGVHSHSDDFGLLSTVDLPTYGIGQNSQVNLIHANWDLDINVVEMTFKMPFHFAKWMVISPYGGVKAGFIDQKIRVKVRDFQIFQPVANTPQEVKATNNMYGIGPMIGLDLHFLTPIGFGVFFNGNLAALCERFRLTTKFKEFLNAPSNARLTVREHPSRASMVDQLQAGLDFSWIIRRKHKQYVQFDIAAGWEVQIWSKMLRINFFDTFVEPSTGSDLTLYGPFVRGQIRF